MWGQKQSMIKNFKSEYHPRLASRVFYLYFKILTAQNKNVKNFHNIFGGLPLRWQLLLHLTIVRGVFKTLLNNYDKVYLQKQLRAESR